MRVFLLGATPSFNVVAYPTIEARLAQTGANTGNQLIAYGLLKPLDFSAVEWDHSKGPRYVNENFDVIVIAAANFLFPGFDFGGMADFIAQTKLPVVMVGLGAQSKDYSTKIPLKPGTERLVRLVAERSKLIGVRGPFTAEVLAEMGIKNVQITGCPSFYMNADAEPVIRKGAWPAAPRIAVNASRDVLSHAFDREKMFEIVTGLISEAVRYDGTFVAQTEREEMILADEPGTPQAEKALESFAAVFAKTAIDPTALRDWAKRQMRVYWSVDRWLDDMRRVDFVIGTRFHGAMTALKVGTPAFVLCHDTRTSEMSKFLGIPHASILDVASLSVADLYASVDVAKMTRRRMELLSLYRDFLDANQLAHKFQREFA